MYIIKFMGGLGNQLFQYSLLLKLKELFPHTTIRINTDSYHHHKVHNGFELKNVKYKNKKITDNFLVISEENFDRADFSKNLAFSGYWQDEKFLTNNICNIYNMLFDNMILSENNREILGDINSCESVSVHVRCGDYNNHAVHGNIANKCFFQTAISEIKKKVSLPSFFVFSDDVEWCKKELRLDEQRTYYIDWKSGTQARYDIFLMSKCKHNIISNSSFSWWAQQFNANPHKIVISPEYWYNVPMPFPELKVYKNVITVKNITFVKAPMKDPFFSILIPVFNTEKYLRRCLGSVSNQTYDNIEIICVDDCSTDNSLSILKDYAEYDARIVIAANDINNGLLNARRQGIEMARGRYIVFLDSDDWFVDIACQTLYDNLCVDEPDIIEFPYIEQPIKKIVKNPLIADNERIPRMLDAVNPFPITVWNKAYKTDLLRRSLKQTVGFYATNAEDAYNSVTFLYCAKTYTSIDIPLINYSTGIGVSTKKNRTFNDNQMMIHSFANVLLNLRSFLLTRNQDLYSRCDGLEQRLLKDGIGKILNSTKKEDINRSLLLLPLSFNHEFLCKYMDEISNTITEHHQMMRNRFSKRLKRFVIRRFPCIVNILRRGN